MPTEKLDPDPENNPSPQQDATHMHSPEPMRSGDAELFSAPGQTKQDRRETVKPKEHSRTIGNYKLLQQIGTGGMGQVWMADQTQPVRRRVAIKLIKAGLDNEQVTARFEAERQALAMMDHQCIAKVFDAGSTPDGLPYFVMELVQGIPITKYCDSNRLSLDERLNLFSEIL
ncbi:MAG: protein kinase [Pirellulaceae bacterium]|nr:protein kinase [Pirellulaceae bacterium]